VTTCPVTGAQATGRALPKVPVPKRAAKRPFHKGLLVAANVKIVDGEPVFGKVDHRWVEKALVERLCQLCGKKIAKTDFCAFPGGWRDVRFVEAPLHLECAAYSATVCPNIIRKRDRFSFVLCMQYEVTGVEPDDYRDVAAYVTGKGIGQSLPMTLYFGHTDGCEHDTLQRLSIEELLALLGYGPRPGPQKHGSPED
jgi:hypothetical protein